MIRVSNKAIDKQLDAASFKGLVGRLAMDKVPDLNGMTTALIEKYYDFIKLTWDYASNTSLKDGTPYYRTYSLLSFKEVDSVDIEEIDLQYFDPDLNGRYFYRVTHPFYEENYTGRGDFYSWEYDKYRYMQEILYHNKVSSTKRWERPVSNPQPEDPPEDAPPYVPDYLDITSEPFIIRVKPNKAWGIELSSDGSFDVSIGDEVLHTNTKRVKLSPLITNELTITFREVTNQSAPPLPPSAPSSTGEPPLPPSPRPNIVGIPRVPQPTPTYLEMDLYGEDEARRMYYIGGEIQEDEETLLHKVGTSFRDRLVPPGKPDLPNKFWNYRDDLPPILPEYHNRKMEDASWEII